MRNIIILLFTFLILSSCVEKHKPETKSDNKKVAEKINPFDSLMADLVKKYPDLPKPYSDTVKFSEYFQLIKRVYIPENSYRERNYEINYELWQATPCGGCWDYQFIYIYNDSNHFILPLTDFYYFWKTSGSRIINKDTLKMNLSFEKELNNLVKSFKIENRYYIINDIITTMLGYFQVTKFEIPKMRMIANVVQQKEKDIATSGYDYFHNKNCRSKIQANLERIEMEINKGNQMIYSDGKLTFIFSYYEKNEIEVEVLNYECLAMVIY